MKTVKEWFTDYFVDKVILDNALYHATGQRVVSKEKGTLVEALLTIDPITARQVDEGKKISIDWEAEVRKNKFYLKYVRQ